MRYNIDVSLWRNHTPRGTMQIIDGTLFEGAEGAVARFADDREGARVLREAGFVPKMHAPDFTEWVRPEPKRGLTFEHARVMNQDNTPMLYRVTTTRHGCVFYRPVDAGGSEYTAIADFPKVIKRIIHRP